MSRRSLPLKASRVFRLTLGGRPSPVSAEDRGTCLSHRERVGKRRAPEGGERRLGTEVWR